MPTQINSRTDKMCILLSKKQTNFIGNNFNEPTARSTLRSITSRWTNQSCL